jgi:hypothetical protein
MIPINIQHLNLFIRFAQKELKLSSMPQIKFVGSSENKYDAFGHSISKLIVVRITDRHPIDICRTIGHELIHYKQNILKIKMNNNKKEDQANVMAGRLMQKFDIAHPEVFKDKYVRANMIHESREDILENIGLGNVAANMTGSGIQNFDPLLSLSKAKRGKYNLDKLFYRKKPKSLRQIIKTDMETDK